jgi:hypothetical protein
MQEKNEIFAENAQANIFNGALVSVSKTQPNQIQDFRVIGYRLESNKVENIRVACRQPEDGNGVYRASVYFDGVRRRARNRKSNLFPKLWTKDTVTSAIFEAYQNKVITEVSQKEYTGKTLDGMDIILWLDADGKVLDAMPSYDVAMKRQLRKKPKRTCKICGQLKHNVCLEHHQFKKEKSFVVKCLKRIRYYYRKYYFKLGVKLGLVE